MSISIFCPIFPEDFVKLDENIVLKRLKHACDLAERNGAGIIGLGGFTSVVGDEGRILAGQVDSGITSGNAYTAYLCLKGIEKAARLMKLETASATVAIIGATGDIGSICTKVLATQVKQINVVARNEKKLEDFAAGIRLLGKAAVNVQTSIKEAIKNADIILTATSSITTLIDPRDLKPGAIVCDVAIPANIAREVYSIRQDVLVFEGGKAQLPAGVEIKNNVWQKYFPNGIIFGCLAEVMLLACGGHFKDFSVGRGTITQEKLDYIGSLSETFGFTLAPFRCGSEIINEDKINSIRKNAEDAHEKR